MKTLTVKEEGFCQSLMTLGDQSQAYRDNYQCGNMKPNTVNVKASELAKKPHVAERIKQLRTERSERTKIDADYVLNRLKDFDQLDFLDIMTEEGGFKPVHQWPKAWRQSINGFEMAELMAGQGDDRKIIGVLKKIKWPDKLKILELIGRHVNVQAFKEKVEVTGQLEVTNRILEARKRARAGSET